MRLPTDDSLLTQIKDGFKDGKDFVVTVMSTMGEEQKCALKVIGPKNKLVKVTSFQIPWQKELDAYL
ncbi:hypothetical protein DVH24_018268 [Malus domestica]|uniref:Translation initiation factor 5A C-terminal domain-containing protein n=1 Tax=Malus domestica TaxID=3750 RepID=A0A498KFT6_MALDO|nr:hypothetical protein DVH24_018268 [Malus domestica]